MWWWALLHLKSGRLSGKILAPDAPRFTGLTGLHSGILQMAIASEKQRSTKGQRFWKFSFGFGGRRLSESFGRSLKAILWSIWTLRKQFTSLDKVKNTKVALLKLISKSEFEINQDHPSHWWTVPLLPNHGQEHLAFKLMFISSREMASWSVW